MRQRAYFWHFWRLTPNEYRQLTLREFNAMVAVMKDVARRNRSKR